MDSIELAPRPPLPGPYPSFDSSTPLTPGDREIDPDQASQRHSTNEVSLHPVDTGFGAWSFVRYTQLQPKHSIQRLRS